MADLYPEEDEDERKGMPKEHLNKVRCIHQDEYHFSLC